jgi:hypothetical protein
VLCVVSTEEEEEEEEEEEWNRRGRLSGYNLNINKGFTYRY